MDASPDIVFDDNSSHSESQKTNQSLPPIHFYLQNQATSEALCWACKNRGIDAQSFHSIALQAGKNMAELRSDVLVIDPGLLSGGHDEYQPVMQNGMKIIFLCQEIKSTYLKLAIAMNVQAVMCMEAPLSEMLDIFERILKGEINEHWCPHALELCEADPKAGKKRLKSNTLYQLLTPRQIEVLTHLAEGKTVKEVAQQMHLSQKSVDSHKYRIMNRLHIHDRVHLSRLAIREGLIDP